MDGDSQTLQPDTSASPQTQALMSCMLRSVKTHISQIPFRDEDSQTLQLDTSASPQTLASTSYMQIQYAIHISPNSPGFAGFKQF